ncbi:hypothetical protein Purlil1_9839 [Purpureocillium lilacinum]|uniref:Tat pathway signal sequence n=1 Tax=Purpureocillium lilacinum TaxID=33203 RepID=A0ABR0BPG0_PURLI|nr:hypothetical protein Purlil1_9839 [Purpureocillium lilacinum]
MSGDEQEEKTSFLRSEQQLNRHHDATTTTTTTRFFDSYNLRLWQFATAVLTVLLVVSVYFNQWLGPGPSYETGFDTDLEPAARNSAIRMQKTKFAGGIIVNESSQFELVLDRDGPRYVGHPTRELDAAWDKLVGNYVALTKSEAERIGGHVSQDGGAYFVVTHVRHSLHCVNYLRKVAYEKWYPTIRHENKSSVPTFWQHVDHCVETLRQTIQCQSDLTPVPHVWSEGKGMYIADTSLEHTCRDYDAVMEWQDERERAWKAGEIHD